MEFTELLKDNRLKIFQIGTRHGVMNIRVFGSVARGEATPESDIDFLVDVQSGRSLLDLGGFLTEVHDLLGCRVDVVTPKGLRERIRARVLKEAIPL